MNTKKLKLIIFMMFLLNIIFNVQAMESVKGFFLPGAIILGGIALLFNVTKNKGRNEGIEEVLEIVQNKRMVQDSNVHEIRAILKRNN
jgi:uncharacterized membrane protein (DUF4010 family)